MQKNTHTGILFKSSSRTAQPQPPIIQAGLATGTLQPKYALTPYRPSQHTTIIKRRQRAISWPVKIAGAISASVMLLTIGFAWHTYAQVSQVFQGKVTKTEVDSKDASVQLLSGENQGRVHLLVMGTAGAKYQASDLTDTMAIMSIDIVTKKVTMLPLPKDLKVTMPNQYFGAQQALNTVYASGKYNFLGKAAYTRNDPETVQAGFAAIDKVVHEITGIAIDYNIVVNFDSFGSAIDAIGGVSIKLPQRYHDASMVAEYNHKPLTIPAGNQVLDGKKALQYARSMQDGEEARSKRQLQIINGFVEQLIAMESANQVSALPKLFHSLSANMRTDLSLQAAQRLFTIGTSGYDTEAVQVISLADLLEPDGNEAAPMVQPKLGPGQYKQIQDYVQSKLPSDTVAREQGKVVVMSDATQAADARLQELRSTGMVVTQYPQTTATSVVKPHKSVIIDVSNGRAPYTRYVLSQYYQAAVQSEVPAGLQVPDGADFVILPSA